MTEHFGVLAMDETGKKYGHLEVLQRVTPGPGGHARFQCLCDCGRTTLVTGSRLRTGATRTCGSSRCKAQL